MNPQQYRLFVGGRLQSLDTTAVENLLTRIESSVVEGAKGKRVDQAVRQVFGGDHEPVSLTEAQDIVGQLAAKAQQLEGDGLSQLFNRVHGEVAVAAQQQSQIPADNHPYHGPKFDNEIEKILSGHPNGTYIVAANLQKMGEISVGIQIGGPPRFNKIMKYKFKSNPKRPGGFLAPTRPGPDAPELTFDSLTAVINTLKSQKIVTNPVHPDTHYDTAAVTREDLGDAYYPDLSYEEAIARISKSRPGTYLVVDRVNDPNSKVIIYNSQADGVRADVLLVAPGSTGGVHVWRSLGSTAHKLDVEKTGRQNCPLREGLPPARGGVYGSKASRRPRPGTTGV